VILSKGLNLANVKILPAVYLHPIKVARIKIRAFRVVHPCCLVLLFRTLRRSPKPFVEVCSHRGHFSVKFSSVLGGTIKDILVDAKNCFMNARLDFLEFDNVDERFDVRPLVLVCTGEFYVRQTPELEACTRKLFMY
jgi:hypothetical protein